MPVIHAAESLREAGVAGIAIAYVTNNASRTPESVAQHLHEFGLDVAPHDVVTSAQAGSRLVAELVEPGARVLAVGGEGVRAALHERGFELVQSADDRPAAVLQGYGPDVGWRDLAEAAYSIAAGAVHVATNTDLTVPTARGRAPGNGTLVAAVVSATGVQPHVAGKPESALMLESIERMQAKAALMVGDRLDTDIEAASRLSMPSLLVLTGVTDVDTLCRAEPHQRPTYVCDDLRGLLEPYPQVSVDHGKANCLGWQFDYANGTVSCTSRSEALIDGIRALSALCWWCADHELPLDIHAALNLV
jgi:HAD superfamily hydrolase (TIGR01450 family)